MSYVHLAFTISFNHLNCRLLIEIFVEVHSRNSTAID